MKSIEISSYEVYMDRAIALAEKGRGETSPNPMVGALIIKDDRVIAEGYHERAGEPHAEINALKNAVEDVTGATMVVSLEPCNHFGRTPPCTEAIIEAGIGKVVVGMVDPNPKCAGGGIKRLRDAGIEVEYGLLADKLAKQNEAFIKYITTGRPFVVLKTAISLDGKISEAPGMTTAITGFDTKQKVHELRSEHDAIMAGIGTVIADDPMLTTRLEGVKAKNPIRVIVDSKARTPLSSRIVKSAREVRTIVAAGSRAAPANIEDLKARGIEVLKLGRWDGAVDVELLLEELGRLEISSVLVEGGSSLIASLVKAGMVDKYIVFVAPKLLGENGVDFVGGKLESARMLRITATERFGDDILIEAYPADS
ncbi:MAG: bifunctional diaminohydroxyphosphoribosylaminopyrimidine deaminase/5-amino-6-(5-phosphoribosylamino)uracil reductase RibD [Actinomycetota bacterium]|nr:bifunctional diaminohydroxyphosphoribosylaminopyrimidine deaminase/5-amino-6-(5-phosphoribosylamino)uracil reductase RibD [Actinomycetota bacterium]